MKFKNIVFFLILFFLIGMRVKAESCMSEWNETGICDEYINGCAWHKSNQSGETYCVHTEKGDAIMECKKKSGYDWDKAKDKCVETKSNSSDTGKVENGSNSSDTGKEENGSTSSDTGKEENGSTSSESSSGSKHVSCGNVLDIPKKIPELTSFFITVAQVLTAVILVLMGTIDLFKGITAQKEDEIKRGQQLFIKRLITASLVFFVVLIVKLIVGAISNSVSSKNIVKCIDCFLNNECNENNEVEVHQEGGYCKANCSSYGTKETCENRKGSVCKWASSKCVNNESNEYNDKCINRNYKECTAGADDKSYSAYNCKWISDKNW